MNLVSFSDYLGIVMAVFAIVTFVYAVRESRKATKEYRRALELSEEYNKLVEKYRVRILNWEELVKELANQVSTETESIMLAIDTLSYGAVTVPDAYRKFWSALIAKAAARTSIQIVTSSENAQIQMIKEQFGENMARSPREDIAHAMKDHFERIEALQKQGEGSVNIILTEYFPIHLFIFTKNNTAIFALQELVGDGTVRTHAIKTQDTTLIDICHHSFMKMQKIARELRK